MIENENIKIIPKIEELSDIKALIKQEDEIKRENVEDKVKSRTRGNYFCNFCKKVFNRKDRYDRHVFSHTGIVSIIFSDTEMIRGINRALNLSFQKQFRCTAIGCIKEYSNEFHLRRHIRISHESKPTIEIFVCEHPNCNQEFTNRCNMKRHYRVKHIAAAPTYSCTECNTTFRRKNLLSKHLKIMHNIGEFKYTCKKCEKGFFFLPAYTKHTRTHNKKLKPRECDNCPLTFTKWSDLVRHRREEHKMVLIGEFFCDNCPRSFKWKKSLRFHMKVHLKHETDVFQCPHENCTKFYTTMSNLKAHIRSKHEGQRFLCTICNLNFSTKQRFEQHINRHFDPKTDIKESCLSLLVGLNVRMEKVEETDCFKMQAPVNIDVPTESEISD